MHPSFILSFSIFKTDLRDSFDLLLPHYYHLWDCLWFIGLRIYFTSSQLIMSRSLFIFITPIVLSLDLISWSYPFSGSRPFYGLLLITLISFTLFITCRSLSFTSVSPLFHLCFTFVSLWFHFHLWCPITFYAQPCTAVYSCAQPHLVVYIFSSLHWCTPVLTLSISWSVIDARPSLAYGFPTEYWPHLVIRSA